MSWTVLRRQAIKDFITLPQPLLQIHVLVYSRTNKFMLRIKSKVTNPWVVDRELIAILTQQ